MITLKDIESVLSTSFKDYKLDDTEKQTVIELIKKCNQEQRSYARNLAFKLAKPTLTTHNDLSLAGFKWLERTIKALDQGAPSTFAKAYFSPGDECRNAINSQCLQAQQSIDACIFTLSDNYIRDALLAAHTRGITVRIITDNDKSQDLGSDIAALAAAGITIRMDNSHHHMHHKYVIFDGHTLMNGSFNWTRSASQWNEENVTLIKDSALTTCFKANFEQLWQAFG